MLEVLYQEPQEMEPDPPPPTQPAGRFVAILLEPVSDDDGRPSFLNRALALNSNLPFGCEKLQMADRSPMHMRTHDRFDVWIARDTQGTHKGLQKPISAPNV